MDKNVLVAFRIEAGRNFLDQLYKDGLDVYVAFWAKSRDAGSWYLYVATDATAHGQKVAAYEQVFASLSKLERRGGRELELTFNDIKFIDPSNPLARAAVYIREVNPRNRTSPPVVDDFRIVADYGTPEIEEGYVYPPYGRMTEKEVLAAVIKMFQSGRQSDSQIEFADGTRMAAIPEGLYFNDQSGTPQIALVDTTTRKKRVVNFAEIVSIL